MPRPNGRKPNQLRPLTFTRNYLGQAPGRVLVTMGKTAVLCSCSVEMAVPEFLEGKGTGWLTAEYGMLPGSTNKRKPRDKAGKVDGRSVEIQRLIGRSLRAVVDLDKLGERTLWVDCDVLEADGGTRTAAITGSWVALYDCIKWMEKRDMVKPGVLRDHVAAVSAGIWAGKPVLDLDYLEDSDADADANFVMTGSGGIVEVQGTAEKTPFAQATFDELMVLARKGIMELVSLQKLTVA